MLFRSIEKDYGIVITRAMRTVEAILANEEIALQLKIKEGAPVMLFKGQVYADIRGKEVIVEYFEAIYRSDQFQFYIEQHR